MRYVLWHAHKGPSLVAKYGDVIPDKLSLDTLADDEAKDGWVQSLDKDDQVCTVFGATDQIALALHDREVSVSRIPFYRIPGFEKGVGKKPSELPVIMAIVANSANQRPEDFYQFRPLDASIAHLKATAYGLYTIQEGLRKPAQLRLQSVYREEYLTAAVRPTMKEEAYVKQRLAESPIFPAIEEEEAQWLAKVKQALRGIPIWEHGLKGTAFRGIGPALAGTIIGVTGDIRRFPNHDAYVAYCGAHVIEARAFLREHDIKDEMAQRRAGQVANWKRQLRQAMWKWSSMQIPKMAAQERFKDEPWVTMYLQFHSREIEKREAKGIPEEGQIITTSSSGNGQPKKQRWFGPGHLRRRAQAKLRTRLAKGIYQRWNQLVIAGDM